jgi:hypothetical protein
MSKPVKTVKIMKPRTIAIKKGRTHLGVSECAKMLNPETCGLLGQINQQFDETNQRLYDITNILKKLECVDRGLRRKEERIHAQLEKLQAKLQQKTDRIAALREQGRSAAAEIKELGKVRAELQKVQREKAAVDKDIRENSAKFEAMRQQLENYKKLEATFVDISNNLGLLDSRSRKIYDTLTSKKPESAAPTIPRPKPSMSVPVAPMPSAPMVEELEDLNPSLPFEPMDVDPADEIGRVEDPPNEDLASEFEDLDSIPLNMDGAAPAPGRPIDPAAEQRAAQLIAESRALTGRTIRYGAATQVELNEIKKALKASGDNLAALLPQNISEATRHEIQMRLRSIGSKIQKIVTTIENKKASRRSARLSGTRPPGL